MKLKSFFAVISFCLAFGLCGCGGTERPAGENSPPSASSSQRGDDVTAKLDETSVVLEKGETRLLTLTVAGGGGFVPVWSSTDESVAVVMGSGTSAVVTASGTGSAAVCVSRQGEIIARCEITVKEPALFVNVPAGKLVLRKGRVATVKAILNDSALTGTAVWKSSDDSVAEVTAQGLTAMVSAVARGECTITVSYGGVSRSFAVIVGIS